MIDARRALAPTLLAIASCLIPACASPPPVADAGLASMDIRVSLQPASERGLAVTRAEATLTAGDRRRRVDLALEAQGRSAAARVDSLAPGAYLLDLRVWEGATVVGGGSGEVVADPGVVNNALILFASFESTFLANLSARTGLAFDLPTEAQWEYACRAGTSGAYNNDLPCLVAEPDDELADANLEPLAWYGHNWPGQASGIGTRRVGQKQPNAWGLYDMHGNVWELCRDWFGGEPVDAVDPAGPPTGKKRVARGGSYHAWPAICRSAQRMPAREQFQATGLRVVCADPGDDGAQTYLIIDLSAGPQATGYPRGYQDVLPPEIAADDACRTTQLVLRRIPAGTFDMGSPPGEPGRADNEREHRVTLSEDYYIGIFEVTQGQWRAVMGGNPSRYVGDDLPVETVTWQDDIRGGTWPPRH